MRTHGYFFFIQRSSITEIFQKMHFFPAKTVLVRYRHIFNWAAVSWTQLAAIILFWSHVRHRIAVSSDVSITTHATIKLARLLVHLTWIGLTQFPFPVWFICVCLRHENNSLLVTTPDRLWKECFKYLNGGGLTCYTCCFLTQFSSPHFLSLCCWAIYVCTR